MVGRVRGNVTYIVTYNFDNVLEWYLETNGLRVTVVDKNPLEPNNPDVQVLHLHGFLPNDLTRWQVSKEIVFTEEEFNRRERGRNYWKSVVDEFNKNHIFLSVGLSAKSICDDIVPYLDVLNDEWYDKEKIQRGHPYGFSFLTRCEDAQATKMLEYGVVPVVLGDYEQIPMAIFQIAQKAMRP